MESTYRPVLMSPSDVAHLLGKPVGTVKRWAHEGRLTSHDGRYDFLEVHDVATGLIKVPPKRTPLPTAA
ncbi:helix-turn-helix domain-containing protein [Streptomyces sp. LBUM 1483]|nr:MULTISPECIES: helix-turn-helix domain-containing protein [Streptomyces]MBP5926703.1 helix-turn-helix domain-containing protein [Streptomyces sp. LBUM 1483]MDX3672726.1 helix-turn-helix domain-containing protein [Streptomyces europaeiscabiei]